MVLMPNRTSGSESQKRYVSVCVMLTCIDVIGPTTGLGAGAGWRTTGVEHVINRTFHFTVIYRLALVRTAKKERDVNQHLSDTLLQTLSEEHRKRGSEVFDRPPRKTGVQLHLRPTAPEINRDGGKEEKKRKDKWRIRQIKFSLKSYLK